MARTKKTGFLKAKEFLGRLQSTVQGLPTDAEKTQAKEGIAALTEFLGTLESTIDSLPSADEVGRITEALKSLESLFTKAEANPVLAGLVPPARAAARRKTSPTTPAREKNGARADLDQLSDLPAEEIRARLLDENGYSLSRLRAMAELLKINGPDKLGRESLAHQVTMKIANYRGYQRLSGQASAE